MEKKLLSDKFYERIKALRPRYPTQQALLLPALHMAQEEWGWLPEKVLDEIADCLSLHPAQTREVASFYTMFNLKPVGKYHIKLCTNISCFLRGSEKLRGWLEKKCDVKAGETSKDKKFTLDEEECLGACGTAPAMMINNEYHENLDIDKLDEILAGLK